jgi:hypothetical protein
VSTNVYAGVGDFENEPFDTVVRVTGDPEPDFTGADLYIVRGTTLSWDIVSTDPDTGTKHLRASNSEGGHSLIEVFPYPSYDGVSSEFSIHYFPVVGGTAFSYSMRAKSSHPNMFSPTYLFWLGLIEYSEAGTELAQHDWLPSFTDEEDVPGTYYTYGVSGTLNANTHTVSVYMAFDVAGPSPGEGINDPPTFDLDNINLTVTIPESTTVLYISNTGFRFPYQRWT